MFCCLSRLLSEDWIDGEFTTKISQYRPELKLSDYGMQWWNIARHRKFRFEIDVNHLIHGKFYESNTVIAKSISMWNSHCEWLLIQNFEINFRLNLDWLKSKFKPRSYSKVKLIWRKPKTSNKVLTKSMKLIRCHPNVSLTDRAPLVAGEHFRLWTLETELQTLKVKRLSWRETSNAIVYIRFF